MIDLTCMAYGTADDANPAAVPAACTSRIDFECVDVARGSGPKSAKFSNGMYMNIKSY